MPLLVNWELSGLSSTCYIKVFFVVVKMLKTRTFNSLTATLGQNQVQVDVMP